VAAESAGEVSSAENPFPREQTGGPIQAIAMNASEVTAAGT
jgi:hypothetical protein